MLSHANQQPKEKKLKQVTSQERHCVLARNGDACRATSNRNRSVAILDDSVTVCCVRLPAVRSASTAANGHRALW